MKAKRYYIYQLSRHLIPVYPVYLIMFTEHGLSMSSISLLLMIWALPVVLIEIPTGVLSDLYGRKAPVLLGTMLHAACFAIWLFAGSFVLFALGFVCWGISEAFISGALEALLFESLKSEGLQDQFDKIYARGESVARIGLAAAMVGGGFVTQYLGYNVTLSLSVISLVVATVTILPVRDTFVRRSRNYEVSDIAGPAVLKSALVFLIHSKTILIPALLGILVVGLYALIDEYDAAVAAVYMPSILLIAIWGTGRFILEAVGAFIAPVINRKIKYRGDSIPGIIAISILAAGALLVFAYIRSPIAIILYAFYYMTMAAMQVILEDYIQQKIDNAGRSTVHSVLSLALNLYAVLLLGIISIIMTQAVIHMLLAITAGYAIIIALTLGIIYSRLKRSDVSPSSNS